MKSIRTLALFPLAILGLAAGLSAQAQVLKVTVPFDFAVGSTSLPAGNYLVSSPYAGVVRVQNADKPLSATIVGEHSNVDPSRQSKIAFTRYGTYYFLHGIQCPSFARLNLNIAAWSLEKRIRTAEARLEKPEQVFLAAR